ncbi:porin [Tianweitania populi]|uniref:Porin n=1 Tax=Tianweitania populi TaxID=1607949 RepID=A0A8J3DLD6_9HYPH|nr:porin [Tianweitania populi]GHD06740.1 porin [Tianweitania populi]
MNIKSLLLGSAAAMIAVSGARAADAVVIAEPEPVEYVRVCDVYGTGYFYIPGTETCLKVGGYVRFEVRNIGGDDEDFNNDGYDTRARFAPTFTVKSETELGTLTGYGRIFAQYDSNGANDTTIEHAQISLATATGTFLVGYGDTPYSRFLDYGGPTINDGSYGDTNASEISYTFTGGNGFSAIIAAVDNDVNGDWDTNFEGGVRFTQAWGWIGGLAGYDGVEEEFGAKVGVGFKIPNTAIELTVQGLYSSEDDFGHFYSIRDNGDAYGDFDYAEWAVLAGASVAFNEKVGLAGTFQYFDTEEFFAAVSLPISPVAGLSITPEVNYVSRNEEFNGILRFQRSF